MPTRRFVLAAFAWMLIASSGHAAGLADTCTSTPTVPAVQPSTPPNLGILKVQLLRYVCSGEHDRAVETKLAEARAFVERRAGEVAKPALVLDIDETALSNWRRIAANDFAYFPGGSCDYPPKAPCGARAFETGGHGAVIGPTLDLFNAAKARGVAVFFISGRAGDEVQRAATTANLQDVGFTGWTELILRADGERGLPAATYKSARRAAIAAQGYTIIANVGDQESDLAGGHAERVFLVPNPFYVIE